MVCLVIVTFNRLKLLQRLYESLKNLSVKPTSIVIVNNGSTDGTFDFLKKISVDNQTFKIHVINQENKGGAGGFHEGIKFAQGLNADYLWLMDDDGFPEKYSLERLISVSEEFKENIVVGSVCVCEDEPDILSFPYTNLQTEMKIYSYKELESMSHGKKIPNWINPFNSILISKDVIKKVGLPNPKLFLWGDETEYYFRMKESNVQIFGILDAVHFHPMNRQNFTYFRGNFFLDVDVTWKAYCYHRNYSYMWRKKFKFFGIRTLLLNIKFQFLNKNFKKAFVNSYIILMAHFHGYFKYLDKKLPF